MSIPSNGITAEVIRDIMHPYHLSADLLEATLAAIPAPTPDAPKTWRLAGLTRLVDEIAAPKPAIAEQARIAAEILITRELANALAHRAHAPDQTTEQVCRLARTANVLLQTAVSLDRSLTCHQQKPSPFFGIVVQDEVDLPALDASWRTQPAHPDAAPPPPLREATPPPDAPPRPAPPADQPDATLPTTDAADVAGLPTVAPTPLPTNPTTTEPPAPLAGSPDTAAHPDQDTGPEWTITKLDEGPGWSREVLRHRSHREPANNAKPGSAT
jgi:hypothetical protein